MLFFSTTGLVKMVQGRKAAHSREDILAKGFDLFSRQGYHATGLATILKECQVSKGSFYNFFGSKEQFAIEILDHYHQAEWEKWEQEFNRVEGRIFAKMRIILEQKIQMREQNADHYGCLLANLTGELGDCDSSFNATIRTYIQQILDAITGDFEEAQRDGDIRSDIDARTLACAFWDSWQGALLRVKVENTATPMRETIELYWNHILPPKQQETADESPS